MPSESFTEVGSHTWEVLSGVRFIDAYAEGAEGGFNGGKGGSIGGVFDIEDAQELYIYVGGEGERASSDDDAEGGFNGGGDGIKATNGGALSRPGSGGGASDIRTSDVLEERKIVAGGGGGGGDTDDDADYTVFSDSGSGGDGGPLTGGSGEDAEASSSDGSLEVDGGTGGNQSSGGSINGDFLSGGEGQTGTGGTDSPRAVSGGSGGGGWYGGGGGRSDQNSAFAVAGGGGGGSNYISTSADINERGTNSGDGYVEFTYADRPENPSISLSNGSEISLSWSAGGSDIDDYAVYRSTSSGIDFTNDSPLATTSDTSYVDNEIEEGKTYYYKIVARYESTKTESIEVSQQTELPEPDSMEHANVTDVSVDLSWNLNSSDENGVRVYRSLSGGSFDEITTLSNGTQSYTDSNLLNGRDYSYYIEVFTDEVEKSSNETSFTTDINNPGDIIADSNVRGVVNISWSSDLNNGDFYMELENLTEETTQETRTVDHQDNQVEFTGDIDDSIEYEFRIRSETEDVTGEFISTTVLSFLPRSRITDVQYSTEQNVIIHFEKIDNFEGGFFEIYRSEQEGEQGNMIREVSDTRNSVVDASVEPFKTYFYTVRRVIE